jgi:pimeloyl-ACP methyl ester carboxylesterase
MRKASVILAQAAIQVLSAFAASAFAATPVPSNKWSFEFRDARGRPDRPVRVYTYRPRQCETRCPIVFVMHGAKRDASNYRTHWEFAADRYGFIVIAPEMHAWPKAAAYNLGDVAAQDDREKWAFSMIEHLFDEVRDGQKDYRIFGHSAGGQFVQRMALFLPDNRASVLIAANPGWYTMPEWRTDKGAEPFPYSLVGARAGEQELRKALSKRFVLMVGEKDNDPDDENLNKSAGAMKQGEMRVERAENFFKAATGAANDLGVKLAWELIEVPDTAHDGEKLSHAAADLLYKKK